MIALDATLRGYKVALVERYDFSSGTSSRSTNLLHGGVRYLEDAVKHLNWKEFMLVFVPSAVNGVTSRKLYMNGSICCKMLLI